MPTSSEGALLGKIAEAPYYSVQIVPPTAANRSLSEIRRIVPESVVSIRGWDFPHAANRETFTGDEYIFGIVDWGRHRELWRAYPSGQFVFLGNIWDVDPGTQAHLMAELRRSVVTATEEQRAAARGAISFVGIIYSVTEFYLFAARLSTALEEAGLIRIRVALHGVEHWALAAGEPGVIWHSFYQSQVPKITSDVKVPTIELVADPLGKARVVIREIFARFDWHDIADTTISDWQKRIVKRGFD